MTINGGKTVQRSAFCIRGSDGRFCTAVFCDNLGATRTRAQDRRLWIWISTENLDMDGKFYMHGKPENFLFLSFDMRKK